MGRRPGIQYRGGSFWRSDDRTSDVRPNLSINNLTDQALANAIPLGKYPLLSSFSGVFSADRKDSFVSQFCALVSFSSLVPCHALMAPFCNAILLVYKIIANEEMAWINTRGVVALVQNILARWYATKMQFPRRAMRQSLDAMIAKAAVTLLLPIRGPLPAIRDWVDQNFGHEALKNAEIRGHCGIILNRTLFCKWAAYGT